MSWMPHNRAFWRLHFSSSLKYLTVTFLLDSCLDSCQNLVRFLHGQGQKNEQKQAKFPSINLCSCFTLLCFTFTLLLLVYLVIL